MYIYKYGFDIYFTEMSGPSSGAGGALRSLRTRRPFTPREPQRTLFTERTRKKDTRPPSAFEYINFRYSLFNLVSSLSKRTIITTNLEFIVISRKIKYVKCYFFK